jgi:hypothetical protein
MCLSLASNLVTSFNGLPNLETIAASENSLEFGRSLAVQAIGLVLKSLFSWEPLTEDDLQRALLLSPLVGFSLCQGRDPRRMDDEMTKTGFLYPRLLK